MDGSACARCRREKRARGEPIFARKPQGAAGQNRGAPAILDRRQSPRRQTMAMLISLSHRDERDYGFAPEPSCGRSGLTAKRYGLCAPPAAPNEVSLTPEAGRPGCAKPGAAQTKTDPCRSQSVGPWPGASHGRGAATEA